MPLDAMGVARDRLRRTWPRLPEGWSAALAV